jgi:hypothetical protein
MNVSEAPHTDYDDSYPTCIKTYATLRLFSAEIVPEEVTEILRIEPTRTFRKGDTHAKGKLQRKTNGWFYSTKKLSNSKDGRRHIDMILDALDGKFDAVNILQARGCEIHITNYWVSGGQGGPWLMPSQMLKLGALNIDIWWDIYFADEDGT